MNQIRISELLDMDLSRQRDELLAHRPKSSDSRVLWWLSIVDQIVSELTHTQGTSTRSAILNLALRVIVLAHGDEDLSDTDAVVFLADLRNHTNTSDDVPFELSPEQITRRALNAITIDKIRLQDIVAREREHLLEDERAWHSSTANESVADIEFDQLDDLRRILSVLEQSVQEIEDESLKRQAMQWLAYKDSVQHGPEISVRGEVLLNRQRSQASDNPNDPFYGGPLT